jgi:putative membrane protein
MPVEPWIFVQPHAMDSLFSDDDRQRIADAIDEAEAATSAEIVPYVVVQSDMYSAARWRGGVLGALLVVSAAALARGAPLPGATPYLADLYVLAAALGVGLAGAVAAGAFPPLTRALTPPDEMAWAVSRRAVEAFMDQEVFATRDRTGILLFVSLLEHRIEVLADQGIDEQVDETAWSDVTDHIRRGIENDRLTQGLLNGLERCGRVLDEHGVEAGPDDEDELSDRLRRDGGEAGTLGSSS